MCNEPSDGGVDTITGFVPGTDRNQNAALFGAVDRMRALVQEEGVGDVRFNTMLLFNADNVALCGAFCQDVYGVFPNVAPADYPAAALAVSRYTLQTLAARGGGAYLEFLNNGDGGVRQVSFTGFDLAGICP